MLKFCKDLNHALATGYLKEAGLDDDEIDRLKGIGYFEAPASKGHHLACPGGLILHSMCVVQDLVGMAMNRFCLPIRSCYRIGMLHDLVKCLCYNRTDKGYEYVQPPYPGHGVASVMICADLGIKLTPEESAAITWHMGAFGLSDRELKEYHASIKRFPEAVILTHAADHLASVREEGMIVC